MCCQFYERKHISGPFLSTVNALLIIFSCLSDISLFSVEFSLYNLLFYRCEKDGENFVPGLQIWNFPELKASVAQGNAWDTQSTVIQSRAVYSCLI